MPDQPRVLKVAAGTRARDYRKHFLEYDLAAIGPGWIGRWGEADPTDFDTGSKRALGALAEAEPGDIALLTVGTEIVTIGEIHDGYDYSERLALIGGWDLYHFIRVKWVNPSRVRRFKGPRHVASLSRAHWLGPGNAEVRQWAQRVYRRLKSKGEFERALEEAPGEDPPLTRHSGLSRLKGPIQTVGRFKQAVEDRAWAEPPSENEAVALLVVPLLLTLGWRPENVALEWKRIDIATFADASRELASCRLLVEAKRPGQGLIFATGQAFTYAKSHELRVPFSSPTGSSTRSTPTLPQTSPSARSICQRSVPAPRRS